MRKDAKTSLYQGSRATNLEADLLLLELKSSNGLTDKDFHDLLNLLQKLLPNTYQAKKMIFPMGLEVQKIHAYCNDCISYRGNYKDLDTSVQSFLVQVFLCHGGER
jgi:hypothetical protein